MARFYGSLDTQKGSSTRTGTVAGGLSGHVRGWAVGVRVDARVADGDKVTGTDTFEVYSTYGSNGGGRAVLLGTVRLVREIPVFTPATKGA